MAAATTGVATGTPSPAFATPAPPDPYVEPMARGMSVGHYGGHLVLPTPAAPKTFNPVLANELSTTQMLFPLVFTSLCRWDPLTLTDEPELARSWEVSPDGLQYTFELRRGLRWSDGVPFTADDVIFNLDVVFDSAVANSTRDLFKDSQGRLPRYEKLDEHRVRFTLREVNVLFLPAIGSLYLGPRHRLQPAHSEGRIAEALSVSTPPAEVPGMGPFRLAAYEAGQRVVLERNPYFWKVDASGNRLPYLDRLIWLVVPDFDAALLRFEQGQLDVYEQVQAEQYDLLQRQQALGQVKVLDLGPALSVNYLSLNWSPALRPDGAPALAPHRRAWFADVRFRRALSHAIDRPGLVRTVLMGRGRPQYCFDSPANATWYHECPRYAHDPARAGALLDEMDLKDRDGDGVREDAQGRPVELTVLTNAENQERIAAGTVIKDGLAAVGVRMHLRPVPFNDLVTRMRESHDWEGLILGWGSAVPPDPVLSKNIFLSSGQLHLWHPRQEHPATEWEAKMDTLVATLSSTLALEGRQAAYRELTDLFAEQQAQIFTYNSNQYVAVREGIGNLRPSRFRPHVYWNAHLLYRAPR